MLRIVVTFVASLVGPGNFSFKTKARYNAINQDSSFLNLIYEKQKFTQSNIQRKNALGFTGRLEKLNNHNLVNSVINTLNSEKQRYYGCY